MDPFTFFKSPMLTSHRQYEALRAFFLEDMSGHDCARQWGYSYRGFTSLVATFRKKLQDDPNGKFFFVELKPGRKVSQRTDSVREMVIDLRKKYYSVPEIKVHMDALHQDISERNILNILQQEGFSRLPRRTKLVKQQLDPLLIEAERSVALSFESETFKSTNAGILIFLRLIRHYRIDQAIARCHYPSTSQIGSLSSILCFLALKLSNRRRYSNDDTWCMDRGMGLFAGLNVLPKAAWFTSYSDRVTSEMNRNLLKELYRVYAREGFLQDTTNLDFTTIPYWGDDEHLENNWSGKRSKALSSMLAVLAQDPDTGIITHADANVMQKEESQVILEFLDFYHAQDVSSKPALKYLVFDSKFTTYENLNKLNKEQIKFITIRRRGKNILGHIEALPEQAWKKIKVACAGNKHRILRVSSEMVSLPGYEDKIRQIIITGHGKIKPSVIITNELDASLEFIIRKYSRRWIVEKTISQQIEFFHLNLVSSSMVIKVDFDLTMSVLAFNLYRLLAAKLQRYENLSIQSIYDKFVLNGADISIEKSRVVVKLKKKRNLPLILETMKEFELQKYSWLDNHKIVFEGATYL
jgi:hypothetical protein